MATVTYQGHGMDTVTLERGHDVNVHFLHQEGAIMLTCRLHEAERKVPARTWDAQVRRAWANKRAGAGLTWFANRDRIEAAMAVRHAPCGVQGIEGIGLTHKRYLETGQGYLDTADALARVIRREEARRRAK